jgi:hypothetical protein
MASTCCWYRVSRKTYPMNAASRARLRTFEVTRVRLVKNRTGISGSEERASTTAMTSSRPTPPSNGSSTGQEPHGCEAACSRPSTMATRPPVAVIAPGTSIRRLAPVIRLSASTRGTMISAKTAIGMLM